MLNKKGFTLIELLATIVIIGILSVLSLPTITNTISKNRNKIYISDAIKMISKVKYIMKSNKGNIEKPKEGECIVFFLSYLDDQDFSSAPSDGEYDKDHSFVVVKKVKEKIITDGKEKEVYSFEYSAMLIEKLKGGGYKGIKLTKYNDLISKNAVTNVKGFTIHELLGDRNKIKDYINSTDNLGVGYVNNVKNQF